MASKRTTIKMAATASAAALSLALAGCGSAPSAGSATTSSGNHASTAPTAGNTPLSGRVSVAISNYSYHPATITVARGTTVTFTNHDQTAHTATSNIPGFDTGTLKPGQQATIHLDKPGSYTYYCQSTRSCTERSS